MLDDTIALRAATAADRPLLARIYASTREDELARAPWSAEQKQHFLSMQFEAQDQHYRAHYANPEFLLILERDVPVGRLYLCRGAHDVRVMDLALLPPFRRRGIGGAILARLRREAGARRQSLSIHVEKENRARALYARHGFVEVEDRGVYLLLHCPAPTADEHAPH